MNIESSKSFQPIEVTELLREQYLSLCLTDDQARAILANMTTRVFIKPSQLDAGPRGAHD